MIYLDSASTTEVASELKETIDRYLYTDYGNPGNLHSLGQKSKNTIETARKQISDSLGCSPDSIIFTSSGSEANTLAIIGLTQYLKRTGLRHIITTKYEHHSVLNAMKEMEGRGFDVTYLDVASGVISLDDIKPSVRRETGLISIMYVNNEIGTINDIKTIYSFCQKKGILFHSDCVQALGSELIEMNAMADMISLSGHKIHAPKGVGCLCVKDKEALSNIIFGGEQEYGLRPGTENVPAIAAFGEAVCHACADKNRVTDKLIQISTHFKQEISQLCQEESLHMQFNARPAAVSPKICSLRFKGIDADTLVLLLSSRGVCVSAGSACSSHSLLPSHVLKAIGLTDEEARSTIRASFSEYNTVIEVRKAAKIIVECVKILKGGGSDV